MARLFFICLALSFSFSLSGQKLSRYYTSSIQEEGTLYFILPQKGFRSMDQGNRFVYDLTHHSAKDSVRLNFSYYDNRPLKFDSLVLKTAESRFDSPLDKLFVEADKSDWHYRFSTSFSFTDLQHFFSTENAPQLQLYYNEETVTFEIKSRKWRKQSGVVSKIFEMINLNKD